MAPGATHERGRLEIERVTVRPDNRRPLPVLHDVTLCVRPGEFLVVVGPSGCGKSTLLNVAAGFLKPSAGTVRLDGRPVDGPSHERAVVLQEHALFPWLTARRNVEFGLHMLNLDPRERRERTDAALKLVHLAHAADRFPRELSGGMRQRVAISLAFSIAVRVAGVLGCVLARAGRVTAMLGGLLLGLQALPSVVWAPPVILLLGTGEAAILLATLLGSVFAMVLIVRDAIRGVPASYRVVGPMLGAHGWRLVRFVLLPGCLPGLVSGLRSGFAFSWRSLLGAELVIGLARGGLGASLRGAQRVDELPAMLASIGVMVLVTILVDRLLFVSLERSVHHRFALASGT